MNILHISIYVIIVTDYIYIYHIVCVKTKRVLYLNTAMTCIVSIHININ